MGCFSLDLNQLQITIVMECRVRKRALLVNTSCHEKEGQKVQVDIICRTDEFDFVPVLMPVIILCLNL